MCWAGYNKLEGESLSKQNKLLDTGSSEEKPFELNRYSDEYQGYNRVAVRPKKFRFQRARLTTKISFEA